ncbi:hypothetical protein BU24DRAFT_427463 [Aaosphaeria arxii CBS 175.79]|uniref:Mitochondrial intermembrane space import and assembly protein 40 n=1 Tax=Aaosphaeria arxii CBS 175.79 TaxID=1450172 RepID=A0A6A5XB82_9PLEO|nr:uncharacterized protein BU24DRAFT_427463 [Aaosphaeria arxii CBS 175.79]KAF2010335.1 hypothetical protein BU24DRAFT_427463 [Aaosphaeria arxii CBS 175.79]
MFQSASRVIARPTVLRALPRASAPARRFLSTAPPTQKSRSWKSLAARIGIAGTIIYYYNTTNVFAEEPRYSPATLPITEDNGEELPTIEAITKERQKRRAEEAAAAETAALVASAEKELEGSNGDGAGGVEALEEEAGQQGAFNPETGEINWDCPCLGGMAHGPCGEEFKAAFSCFVYSTEEEKGIDCIDKFKDMQNCFRQYPEIYGSELEQEEVDKQLAEQDQAAADTAANSTASASSSASEAPAPVEPTASYDTREDNKEKK